MNQRLYLRATLPSRSGGASSQQRLPIGNATPIELAQAEVLSIQLSLEIQNGTFAWKNWIKDEEELKHDESKTHTVQDFIKAAERLHTSKYAKNPERGKESWNKKWKPALNKLPSSGPASEAVLLRVIQQMPASTAARRDQGNLLAHIAESINIDPQKLRKASHGYGVAKLTKRDIPSDEKIVECYEKLREPHWKWAWGCCATFGLRPHELVELEINPDGTATVSDKTKTGSRIVKACPSIWIKKFNLMHPHRPTQSVNSLAKVFGDALERAGIPMRPYALRHAYALRLLSAGVPPELGARLMGHSVQMHTQTYQRWIDADRIKQSMERFKL